MSKIIPLRSFAKDTMPVTAATITTGWKAGQGFKFSSTGEYVELGVSNDVMFIAMDSDDELSAPPSGSLLTVLYGGGTKFVIDHTTEVAASSALRAYESDVESAALNASLYMSANSKFTAVASGSIIAKLFQVPSADNNYGLGVITRI